MKPIYWILIIAAAIALVWYFTRTKEKKGCSTCEAGAAKEKFIQDCIARLEPAGETLVAYNVDADRKTCEQQWADKNPKLA